MFRERAKHPVPITREDVTTIIDKLWRKRTALIFGRTKRTLHEHALFLAIWWLTACRPACLLNVHGRDININRDPTTNFVHPSGEILRSQDDRALRPVRHQHGDKWMGSFVQGFAERRQTDFLATRAAEQRSSTHEGAKHAAESTIDPPWSAYCDGGERGGRGDIITFQLLHINNDVTPLLGLGSSHGDQPHEGSSGGAGSIVPLFQPRTTLGPKRRKSTSKSTTPRRAINRMNK